MSAVLLDTHGWVWSLRNDQRLTQTAREAIAAADQVLVSPISFYEIGQKARLGKWPEIVEVLHRLPDLLREQGAHPAALTPDICLRASLLDWDHRDPFDRFLAATALHLDIPIISAAGAFDGIVQRIW